MLALTEILDQTIKYECRDSSSTDHTDHLAIRPSVCSLLFNSFKNVPYFLLQNKINIQK